MEKFDIQFLVEDDMIEFSNSVVMTYSSSKQDIPIDRRISMLLYKSEWGLLT